jgi:hypothetical protein
MLGRPRRHLMLRDAPPGDLRWLEPVTWRGHAAVLGVFGTRVAVWTQAGRRLCEVALPAEPRAVACRVVTDRLYVACYVHDHGLSVVELPDGNTVFHLADSPGVSVTLSGAHSRQPGAIALDEWSGEPVVGYVSLGQGIKVHDVLSGSEIWSYDEKVSPYSLYLHHMGGRRVAVTVDYHNTLRLLDLDAGTEAARIPVDARIQAVTPLADERVAVLTSTGLYTLRFPTFSPDAAGLSCAGSVPPPRDPPATDASGTSHAVLPALLGSRPPRKRRGRL